MLCYQSDSKKDKTLTGLDLATSVYLDFLRLLSALLVFAYHAKAERLNGQWLSTVGNFGHDAVIVFFVLSGFVIAYTTSRQPADIGGFMKSRLARLYSVALPALLFTVIADSIGQYLKPEIYVAPYYQDSYPIARFISNVFFLNELWFKSWRAFSNGPFWSLSYEFFYYLLYALAFYLTGIKRLVFVSLAALIAGPKILLLLPVWLLGVLLFRASRNFQLHIATGVLLVTGSIALYTLYRISGTPEYLYELTEEVLSTHFVRNKLEFSRWFLNDYLVAMLVAMNILGVVSISGRIRVHDKTGQYIRYFAGMTFALYLFHYPLLQLYASVFNNNAAVVVLTLTSVILLAPVTEGRKSYWLKLMDRIHSCFRKPLHK